MGYDIITIKPTLDTSAYVAGDVLFLGTQVKLPASSCKLINVQAIWDDTQAPSEQIQLMFFQKNLHGLASALNSASDPTGAQLEANVFLGARRVISSSYNEQRLGDPTLLTSGGMAGDSSTETFGPFEDLVLVSGASQDAGQESSTTIAPRNTVFVQGYLEASGGITCDADSLIITLHVEY